jgi:hypothetical protein
VAAAAHGLDLNVRFIFWLFRHHHHMTVPVPVPAPTDMEAAPQTVKAHGYWLASSQEQQLAHPWIHLPTKTKISLVQFC